MCWHLLYLPQASVFERDDVSLPRLASFFQQEARKQQDEAEAMLSHLAVRGGSYCSRDIQVETIYVLIIIIIPCY